MIKSVSWTYFWLELVALLLYDRTYLQFYFSDHISCPRKKINPQKQTFLNSAEVEERVITVVKNFDKVDPSKVSASSKFGDDLGLDSLDAVEVVMAIEDEFAIEIPDAEADMIGSVGDAVEYVAAHPMAK